MSNLRYTLIADGSSDKTLLHIIRWALTQHFPKLPADGQLADFGRLHHPPKSLKDKYCKAKEIYPADIYFIHRDAETNDTDSIQLRTEQIYKEIGQDAVRTVICIIPIKMMETWLMIDAEAIKKAAGNRSYKEPILLPAISKLEKENQPKVTLHKLLKDASGLKGRNLDKFNPHKAVHLLAEYTDDYSPLRKLAAFKAFEESLVGIVTQWEKHS